MNILRWKRKSKKKVKFKILFLFIFSLIMTTFAWFAYSKVLDPTLNIHVASWNMEYYIGANKKENPIGVEIIDLYPTMDENIVTIDIKNNGEKLVDLEYQVKSLTIAGIDFEILEEGETNTTDNYIILSKPALGKNAEGKPVYRDVITNDIFKFPFTVEVEYSAQVPAKMSGVSGTGYLKITVNWVGDNNELDSKWGYIVGEYLAQEPTPTSAMSIELSIDSYQAEPNGTILTETMPSTPATKPYLPTGFSRVPGTNLDNGLVIQDPTGNEYVWIEVPKNTVVYGADGLDITTFSDSEYTTIETALQNYSADFRIREDRYTSHDAIGIGSSKYKTLKQTMLKSIYQNGGFYIGRYETGIEDTPRTSASANISEVTPVIKSGAYPFNYLTCSEAQAKATEMALENSTTSLMFGLQWDLVMKYLSTKCVDIDGANTAYITTDSTTWGNYANNTYDLTNTSAKYSANNGTSWIETPYNKPVSTNVILSTGANSMFSRQNIYDLAGNLSEWTFNIVFNGSTPVGGNGGDYLSDGTKSATYRSNTNSALVGDKNIGFRVTLYSDTGINTAWGEKGV